MNKSKLLTYVAGIIFCITATTNAMQSQEDVSPGIPVTTFEEFEARQGQGLKRARSPENEAVSSDDESFAAARKHQRTDADCQQSPIGRLKAGDKNMAGQDLHDADLRGLDLREIDFTEANLNGAHLEGAHFHRVNFSNAQMHDVYIDGSIFDEETSFSHATFVPKSSIGAQFNHVNLEHVQCQKAKFECRTLRELPQSISPNPQFQVIFPVIFFDCNLDHADFTTAFCRGALFNQCTINHILFDGTDLSYATIHGKPSIFEDVKITGNASLFRANVENIIFKKSLFTNVNFQHANLNALKFHDCGAISGVDMSDVRINGAEFRATELRKVKFIGANMSNVLVLSTGIIAQDVDFDRAILENCAFTGLEYDTKKPARTKGLEHLDQIMISGKRWRIFKFACGGVLIVGGTTAIIIFLPHVSIGLAIGAIKTSLASGATAAAAVAKGYAAAGTAKIALAAAATGKAALAAATGKAALAGTAVLTSAKIATATAAVEAVSVGVAATVATYSTPFVVTACWPGISIYKELANDNYPYPYANSLFERCNFNLTHLGKCHFHYVIFKDSAQFESIDSAAGSLVTHCSKLTENVFSPLESLIQIGAKVDDKTSQDYRAMWGDRSNSDVTKNIFEAIAKTLPSVICSAAFGAINPAAAPLGCAIGGAGASNI